MRTCGIQVDQLPNVSRVPGRAAPRRRPRRQVPMRAECYHHPVRRFTCSKSPLQPGLTRRLGLCHAGASTISPHHHRWWKPQPARHCPRTHTLSAASASCCSRCVSTPTQPSATRRTRCRGGHVAPPQWWTPSTCTCVARAAAARSGSAVGRWCLHRPSRSLRSRWRYARSQRRSRAPAQRLTVAHVIECCAFLADLDDSAGLLGVRQSRHQRAGGVLLVAVAARGRARTCTPA